MGAREGRLNAAAIGVESAESTARRACERTVTHDSQYLCTIYPFDDVHEAEEFLQTIDNRSG
jgi:hypothetical protein